MAPTYYVRTTGSDAHAGTSPSTAWLTFTHALGTHGASVAGASVYVGAGVYRETVAVAVSGASVGGGAGSITAVIGDVDGAQTGDAGQIQLTAFTTNDTTAPSGTALLALGTHTYLSFSLLTLIGGSTNMVTNAAGNHDITFLDCVFNNIPTGNSAISLTSPTTGIPFKIIIDRCIVVSGRGGGAVAFTLSTTASTVSDWDAMCVVRNCLFCTPGSVPISIAGAGTNTNPKGGGIRTYNNHLIGSTCVQVTGTIISASVASEIHNSLLLGSGTGMQAGATGQIIESYNLIEASTPRTNVNAGPGSQTTAYAPLVELGQSYKWGDGTYRQFLAPDGQGSPLLGFGSSASTATNLTTYDWQNRNRPSGGGGGVGVASVQGVGYMEFHDYAVQTTASVQAGTSAGNIVGPGDQFIQVPVDATSSTISIYLLFSSTYGGTNYPAVTLHAQGELGVAAQTQTCSSTPGTWQKLTFSAITPTKQGWVTLQIDSYDQSGQASVLFDTLAVA